MTKRSLKRLYFSDKGNEMERKRVLIFLVIFAAFFSQEAVCKESFELISRSQIEASPSPSGAFFWEEKLSEKYGDYVFEAFERNPQILKSVKKVKPTFSTKDVWVSSLSRAFRFSDGSTLLIFRGCRRGNCPGTGHIVVFDPQKKQAFLLKEENDDWKTFGSPEKRIKEVVFQMLKTKK